MPSARGVLAVERALAILDAITEDRMSLALRAFSGGRGKRSIQVRETMYSASFGELDSEVGAIAAPVFGIDGKLMGGLTVSGPRHRLELLGVGEVVPVLFKYAKELTRAFGGNIDAPKYSGWRTPS